METELFEKLKKQAQEEELTISEYCRNKLKQNSKILKIEIMMDKIFSILEDRKIYKQVPRKNSRYIIK
ncbi:hypothetical protein HYV49_04905 [Candidatus Pacearchaeota archaeon]|nr:hypothetical protein [Candidatus Pacearchaeota archaeon]